MVSPSGSSKFHFGFGFVRKLEKRNLCNLRIFHLIAGAGKSALAKIRFANRAKMAN